MPHGIAVEVDIHGSSVARTGGSVESWEIASQITASVGVDSDSQEGRKATYGIASAISCSIGCSRID